MSKRFLSLSLFFVIFLIACTKTTPTTTTNVDSLNRNILTSIAYHVCEASYTEMYSRATALENAVLALQATPGEANLAACKTAWEDIRRTWETTESWLLGPVSANNMKVRIDSWPVNLTAIDSVANTADPLTEAYIDNLQGSQKGFHTIEYFIWGAAGNKIASDLTARQLEYMVAICKNLSKLSKEVLDTWKNTYTHELSIAGSGSATYPTKTAAFAEIADAMTGICGEVANVKMNGPLAAQNPMLEESPFSKNSMVDFIQNIQGVLVIYTGNYNGNEKFGLEDLVLEYNPALDQEIKSAHSAAITALNNITVPFGEAIISQPALVQTAIDKIILLQQKLDTKLKPYLQEHGK